MDIEALTQERMEADTDFQAQIMDLPDDEKATAISAKKSEIIASELASLTERATKGEELANNYKTRAEKAEQEAKKFKPVIAKDVRQEADLSPKDLYALMDAKVPQDDIEEVTKAAKLLGKSVPEVLKDELLMSHLKTRQEHRRTAEAANTGKGKPGVKEPTEDDVLNDAVKGDKIPTRGSKEAEKLFWARRGGKK